MYNKKAAASVEKKDIKFIPAGINEDVVLKSAKTEESPNGSRFLEIVFEKNGATLTHTEWEPKMNAYTTTVAQLTEKQNNQYSRMLQILDCFYNDDHIDFEGESFKEFAEYIVNKLNSADKTKKLRVKVVYNDRGYTTLPKYAKYTFIEPMILPEGKTTAIAALGIDMFTKPIVADVETPSTGGLDAFTGSTTTTNNDELPF